MHRLLTIALCLILTLNLSAEEKRAMMWFDATANFERFSHRDSISHYLQKISAIRSTAASWPTSTRRTPTACVAPSRPA